MSKFHPDLSTRLKDIAEKQVPAKLRPISRCTMHGGLNVFLLARLAEPHLNPTSPLDSGPVHLIPSRATHTGSVSSVEGKHTITNGTTIDCHPSEPP